MTLNACAVHQPARFPLQHQRSNKHASLQAHQHLLTSEELLSLGLAHDQCGHTGQDVLPVHLVGLQDLLQLQDRVLRAERHEQLQE